MLVLVYTISPLSLSLAIYLPGFKYFRPDRPDSNPFLLLIRAVMRVKWAGGSQDLWTIRALQSVAHYLWRDRTGGAGQTSSERTSPGQLVSLDYSSLSLSLSLAEPQ